MDKTAIRQAVQKASISGRFEEIMPFVILDGAHNPASAEKLVETIQCEYPNEQITFVIGILADKDVQQILRLLEQVSDDFTSLILLIHEQCQPIKWSNFLMQHRKQRWLTMHPLYRHNHIDSKEPL